MGSNPAPSANRLRSRLITGELRRDGSLTGLRIELEPHDVAAVWNAPGAHYDVTAAWGETPSARTVIAITP